MQELRAQTAIAQCEESESHFKYGFFHWADVQQEAHEQVQQKKEKDEESLPSEQKETVRAALKHFASGFIHTLVIKFTTIKERDSTNFMGMLNESNFEKKFYSGVSI